MQSSPKYVPVLRWKGAEIEAISQTHDSVKGQIAPIFEFVPRDFAKLPADRSSALQVRRMLQTWGWKYRCSVDFSLLDSATMAVAIPHFDRFAEDSLPATICLNLRTAFDFATVRKLGLVKKHGLCIRIDAYELRQAGLSSVILKSVAAAGLVPDMIDIVVDFGVVEAQIDLKQYVESLESIAAWRSFSLLLGAFPPDLSHPEKNNQYEIPRYDWLSFRAYYLAGGIGCYGDYTIQHPIYTEREGRGLNFSASIRYSAPTHWVIMRGEGVFNDEGPGFDQWPANAQMLSHRIDFCGRAFSPADHYIQMMGAQTAVTGGAKEWLTAGINHHLYFVVDQLRNVEATPSAAAVAAASAPDWPAKII